MCKSLLILLYYFNCLWEGAKSQIKGNDYERWAKLDEEKSNRFLVYVKVIDITTILQY
jgi:hypothetical protein